MLPRPFPSPLNWYKVRICRCYRVSRRSKLDEIFHDKLVPANQPDPLSVWKLVRNDLTVIAHDRISRRLVQRVSGRRLRDAENALFTLIA